jgi:superfamily II DNA or RNA helicase
MLCAETLAGIADPLLPELGLARTATPRQAGLAMLAGLLEPLDTAKQNEVSPRWLLPHQADAVARSRAVLERFGGVLVADGVGLGKTFIGLALAELEQRGGGDAVAVVPAALRREWEDAARRVAVSVAIHTHAELSRRVPSIPAATSLALVDEAHAFRNPATRRYDALARLAVGRRVALLTATPLNNSTSDLAALVHLFASRDRFREFGVADFWTALSGPDPSAASLALGAVSVCRTRRLVEESFPALRDAFPRRVLLPPVRYDLDATFGDRLDELLDALGGLVAGEARLERGAALIHLSLLRRLESSRSSLRRSLLRQRDFLAEWRRAREHGLTLRRRDFRAAFPRGEGDDAQLVFWPLLLADRGDDAAHVRQWREAVDRALDCLEGLDDHPDPKLAALESLLLGGELAGRKTIVFTEHRDTALYLQRRLRHRLRSIAVVGDTAYAGTSRLARAEALDAFAPASRRAARHSLLEADVLVATDVASEGLNLQDAAAVVNYDLPWNPVRVMQRVGRVERLGSPHARVYVAHLMPARGLERVARVLERLRAKLEDTGRTLGAEPDPLAALWWLDAGTPLPEAVERESWRRVAPFEARERWRALVQNSMSDAAGYRASGPGCPVGTPRHRSSHRGSPLVAAGVTGEAGRAGAGILLALEWPDGRHVPLPFTLGPGGELSRDPVALGELARRALDAEPVPANPGEFTSTLATVLPHARASLLALSAARRGTLITGAGRRAALEAVARRARSLARSRRDLTALGRAQASLATELPSGLDRALSRLVEERRDSNDLPDRIATLLERTLPPPAPDLCGTPRLVLVAAIALATKCASA